MSRFLLIQGLSHWELCFCLHTKQLSPSFSSFFFIGCDEESFEMYWGFFSTPAIAVDGSQIGLYSFTARWSWLPRTFGRVLNQSLGNLWSVRDNQLTTADDSLLTPQE